MRQTTSGWWVTKTSSPNLNANKILYGIDGANAGDIWAVGGASTTGSDYAPVTLPWDGTAWMAVSAGTNAGTLAAMKAITSTKVLAVGYTGFPLIETWNGRNWKVISAPEFPPGSYLFAACNPGKTAWSAGYEHTSMVPHTDSIFIKTGPNQ